MQEFETKELKTLWQELIKYLRNSIGAAIYLYFLDRKLFDEILRKLPYLKYRVKIEELIAELEELGITYEDIEILLFEDFRAEEILLKKFSKAEPKEVSIFSSFVKIKSKYLFWAKSLNPILFKYLLFKGINLIINKLEPSTKTFKIYNVIKEFLGDLKDYTWLHKFEEHAKKIKNQLAYIIPYLNQEEKQKLEVILNNIITKKELTTIERLLLTRILKKLEDNLGKILENEKQVIPVVIYSYLRNKCCFNLRREIYNYSNLGMLCRIAYRDLEFREICVSPYLYEEIVRQFLEELQNFDKYLEENNINANNTS